MNQEREYLYSGVEWLGYIPKNWTLCKIKYDTYVKGRIGWQGLTTSEYIDSGAFLVTGTDFNNGSINWDSCCHVDVTRYNEDPFIQLRNGDLLITKDGTIGKIALLKDLPGIATLNSGIFVTRPINSKYNNEYLFWILSSSVFNDFIEYVKTGSTINHLYQKTFEEFYFPVPKLTEQNFICSFLKQKTSQIDSLIEKKKRLIELLKEYRTAIINHAVTKGLDSNARMKDSGIEWIGQIPEHWEMNRLTCLVDKITNGYVGPTRDILRDEGVKYIQSTHIKDNSIIFDPPYFVSREWSDSHERSKLIKDDLLIVQTGSIGEIGIVTEEFEEANCHALIILRARLSVMSPRYLLYSLTSEYGYNSLHSIKTGALHPHLNATKVKDIYIPTPTMEEQEKIQDYIAKNINLINVAILKIKGQLKLLSEYRTSLISDAVTGKIDVRDYAERVSEPGVT